MLSTRVKNQHPSYSLQHKSYSTQRHSTHAQNLTCEVVPDLVEQIPVFGQQSAVFPSNISDGYDTDSDEQPKLPDHWLGFNRYKTKKYLTQQFNRVHF